MSIARERLAQIRERHSKTTPGPLEVFDGILIRVKPTDPANEDASSLWLLEVSANTTDEDLEFYVNARDDIEALLGIADGGVGMELEGSAMHLKEIIVTLMTQERLNLQQIMQQAIDPDSKLIEVTGLTAGEPLFNEVMTILDSIVRDGLSGKV